MNYKKEEIRLGAGVKFERIRRVTGYLSDLKNFNDAKQAEESSRVKHVKQHATNA